MRLYRITKESRLETYNGLGASYQDGARWNHAGTPVLYFGLSAAVAMLEMANYTGSPRMVPASYRLGVYEVPDDAQVSRLERVDWPDDWSSYPYPLSTQDIGDQWLNEANEFGLILPSAAVTDGLGEIIVINPRHEYAQKIRLIDTYSEIYNPRAFMGL